MSPTGKVGLPRLLYRSEETCALGTSWFSHFLLQYLEYAVGRSQADGGYGNIDVRCVVSYGSYRVSTVVSVPACSVICLLCADAGGEAQSVARSSHHVICAHARLRDECLGHFVAHSSLLQSGRVPGWS